MKYSDEKDYAITQLFKDVSDLKKRIELLSVYEMPVISAGGLPEEKIRETGGPSILDIKSIGDGQIIVRDGTDIVGWDGLETQLRSVQLEVFSFSASTPVSAGSNITFLPIPLAIDGWKLISVRGIVKTVGSSATTIDIKYNGGTMLNANMSIASSQQFGIGSIKEANSIVDYGTDPIYIDVVGAGTGALGLVIEMTFEESVI